MYLHSDGLQAQGNKLLGDPVAVQSQAAVVQATGVKPVLNWVNVCSPEHTSDTSTNYDSFLN